MTQIFHTFIDRISQIVQTKETINKVEKFWTDMSFEKRKELLASGGFWVDANTYFWKYLPNDIKSFVEEEYEKRSLR